MHYSWTKDLWDSLQDNADNILVIFQNSQLQTLSCTHLHVCLIFLFEELALPILYLRVVHIYIYLKNSSIFWSYLAFVFRSSTILTSSFSSIAILIHRYLPQWPVTLCPLIFLKLLGEEVKLNFSRELSPDPAVGDTSECYRCCLQHSPACKNSIRNP